MKKKGIYIIAEIGVNHNGNLHLAKKMIVEAKKCGADAVKFQSFKAEKLASKFTPKVKYQIKNTKKKETHYEMLKKLELNNKQIKYLFNFTKKKGLDFISTPYDVESAKFLSKIGVKIFKTASADLSDFFLHKYLSKINKTVIISTGMSNFKDINNCLNLYPKKNQKKIVLLHCVSNYPCKFDSLNLNCLELLEKKFKLKVGFSDHTTDYLAAIVAVSKNAQIIEKHFTLNKNMSGPDHKTSMEPKIFKDYIKKIRNSEIIMGSKIKKCQKEEYEMKKISIKGIIVNKNIKKNEKIKISDLDLRRPNFGLTGFDLKKILGRKLKKNLLKSEHIKKKHLI